MGNGSSRKYDDKLDDRLFTLQKNEKEMEFLNNKPTQPLRALHIEESNTGGVSLEQIQSYELAREVLAKLGDKQAFMTRFAPLHIVRISTSIAAAIERAEPTLAQCLRTYGNACCVSLLSAHIASMLRDLGEASNFTPESVQIVATCIALNEQARILSMSSVLKFFFDMRCGKYKIFGHYNVRLLNEAFNDFALAQVRVEQQIKQQLAHQRRQEEQQQHAADTLTWEQYAQQHKIDTSLSLEAYMIKQIR